MTWGVQRRLCVARAQGRVRAASAPEQAPACERQGSADVARAYLLRRSDVACFPALSRARRLSRALGWHSIRDGVKTFGPGERALPWHDLRHTAAVVFFDAGLPAPDVQAILGHSSLLVTQLHADTRRLAPRRAVPALSQFLGSQSRGQLGGGESAAKRVVPRRVV